MTWGIAVNVLEIQQREQHDGTDFYLLFVSINVRFSDRFRVFVRVVHGRRIFYVFYCDTVWIITIYPSIMHYIWYDWGSSLPIVFHDFMDDRTLARSLWGQKKKTLGEQLSKSPDTTSIPFLQLIIILQSCIYTAVILSLIARYVSQWHLFSVPLWHKYNIMSFA